MVVEKTVRAEKGMRQEKPGYFYSGRATLSEGPLSTWFKVCNLGSQTFLADVIGADGNSKARVYRFDLSRFNRSNPVDGQTPISAPFAGEWKPEWKPLKTAIEHTNTGKSSNILHFLPDEQIPQEVCVYLSERTNRLDYVPIDAAQS